MHLLILIRLIFLFTCQIILCWPYRYEKKCVSVFMGFCVCLLFCHTTYYVCLNLRVFISLTRKNNCMFTNIKEKKFWTGPVSKVAHIQKLCTAAGSNCCCMNLYLNIMGMARYENIEKRDLNFPLRYAVFRNVKIICRY